jgi:hypothetical protein
MVNIERQQREAAMFAVIVCTVVTVAILTGLLTSIAVAILGARTAIGDALAFDGYAAATPPAVTPWASPRWLPA